VPTSSAARRPRSPLPSLALLVADTARVWRRKLRTALSGEELPALDAVTGNAWMHGGEVQDAAGAGGGVGTDPGGGSAGRGAGSARAVAANTPAGSAAELPAASITPAAAAAATPKAGTSGGPAVAESPLANARPHGSRRVAPGPAPPPPPAAAAAAVAGGVATASFFGPALHLFSDGDDSDDAASVAAAAGMPQKPHRGTPVAGASERDKAAMGRLFASYDEDCEPALEHYTEAAALDD
jgi:hypothetical protein